jgi:hypothetical protein
MLASGEISHVTDHCKNNMLTEDQFHGEKRMAQSFCKITNTGSVDAATKNRFEIVDDDYYYRKYSNSKSKDY